MKPECQRFEALIAHKERNETISPEDERFSETHLAECVDCRALQQALTLMSLRPGDDDHFPMGDLDRHRMLDAVLDRAAAAEEARRPDSERWRWAAVAALIIALAGGALWRLNAMSTKDAVLAQSQKQPATEKRLSSLPETPPPAPTAKVLSWPAQLRFIAGQSSDELGSEMRSGSTVVTNTATLGMSVASRAWVRARPGTRMKFLALEDKRIEVDLSRGQIDVEVTPDLSITCTIKTPFGSVKVLGTIFSVAVGKRETSVTVAQGRVQVDVGSDTVFVESKHTYAGGRLRAATGSELSSLDQAVAQAQLAQSGDGKLLVPTHLAAQIDGVFFEPGPLRVMLTAGKHTVSLRDKTGRSTAIAVDVTNEMTTARAIGKASRPSREMDSPATGVAQQPLATDASEQLLKTAQTARSHRDYSRAARAYQTLLHEYPGSAASEIARVSLGQLQVDRLGMVREGLELCTTYQSRNPEGALLAEAAMCRIRALQLLEQRQEELENIREFLLRWPNDFNAARLSKRQAELEARQ